MKSWWARTPADQMSDAVSNLSFSLPLAARMTSGAAYWRAAMVLRGISGTASSPTKRAASKSMILHVKSGRNQTKSPGPRLPWATSSAWSRSSAAKT